MLPILSRVAWAKLVACLTLSASQPAGLIVTGARIYTLDRSRPIAAARAVRDGRGVCVGDDPSGWAGPNTKRIDARGAAVIPVPAVHVYARKR